MHESLRHGEPGVEYRRPELPSLHDTAKLILEQRPRYVVVADRRTSAETQNLCAALLSALYHSPGYHPGAVGFYTEALYGYARPDRGDWRGRGITLDEFDSCEPTTTNHAGTIQLALNLEIPVRGIDANPNHNPVSEERLRLLVRHLEQGGECTKIILVSQELLSQEKRRADLLHRLRGQVWVLKPEHAVFPAGHGELMATQVRHPWLPDHRYWLAKYQQ